MLETYHGTSKAIAIDLAKGKVSVSKGGGELGRGFYTGEYIWEARAWATHIHRETSNNVVSFSKNIADFYSLHIVPLDGPQATCHRNNIRRAGTTRTHIFKCDVVWSPIVGSEKMRGNQFKWESQNTQVLLNGNSCVRVIS